MGKGRPANKAEKLLGICEPIAYKKYGILDVSQPYGSSQHVTEIALPFIFINTSMIPIEKLTES
jgi:hypothetical protein